MGALKTVELYTKPKGRPCMYDFSPFLSAKQSVVVIACYPSQAVYNSIKSSFARWRKKNNISTGFVFDIHEDGITIWRRLVREKHVNTI